MKFCLDGALSDKDYQKARFNDKNLDMNGRGRIKRKLNHRATWNLDQTEPIAGNYYPSKSKYGCDVGDDIL